MVLNQILTKVPTLNQKFHPKIWKQIITQSLTLLTFYHCPAIDVRSCHRDKQARLIWRII